MVHKNICMNNNRIYTMFFCNVINILNCLNIQEPEKVNELNQVKKNLRLNNTLIFAT